MNVTVRDSNLNVRCKAIKYTIGGTNMEKVQVTEKQAKALDSIRDELANPEDNTVFNSVLSVLKYKQSGLGFVCERRFADELTDEQFLDALVKGYEVEKAVGEQLREIYSKAERIEIEPHGELVNKSSYNLGISRAFNEIQKIYPDLFNLK